MNVREVPQPRANARFAPDRLAALTSVKNGAAATPSYWVFYIIPCGEVLLCCCDKMTSISVLHRLGEPKIYSLVFFQRVSQSRRDSVSSIETRNLACSGPENVLGSCCVAKRLVHRLFMLLSTTISPSRPSLSPPSLAQT